MTSRESRLPASSLTPETLPLDEHSAVLLDAAVEFLKLAGRPDLVVDEIDRRVLVLLTEVDGLFHGGAARIRGAVREMLLVPRPGAEDECRAWTSFPSDGRTIFPFWAIAS